jgi:hypothetical protein
MYFRMLNYSIKACVRICVQHLSMFDLKTFIDSCVSKDIQSSINYPDTKDALIGTILSYMRSAGVEYEFLHDNGETAAFELSRNGVPYKWIEIHSKNHYGEFHCSSVNEKKYMRSLRTASTMACSQCDKNIRMGTFGTRV